MVRQARADKPSTAVHCGESSAGGAKVFHGPQIRHGGDPSSRVASVVPGPEQEPRVIFSGRVNLLLVAATGYRLHKTGTLANCIISSAHYFPRQVLGRRVTLKTRI